MFFGVLPKTSTGKIKKNELRDRAKASNAKQLRKIKNI